jgi:ATP-dependent Lon protease
MTLPPNALPIIPVRKMVLFPGMVVPISIGRKSSIEAAELAVQGLRTTRKHTPVLPANWPTT